MVQVFSSNLNVHLARGVAAQVLCMDQAWSGTNLRGFGSSFIGAHSKFAPGVEGILGYRRMPACLQQQYGEYVSKHRVRRLMRLAGLMGIPKKRRRVPRPGRREQHIPGVP